MKYLILGGLICCQILMSAQIQRLQIGETVSVNIGLEEAHILRYWASKGILYDSVVIACNQHIFDLETQLQIKDQVIDVTKQAVERYSSLYQTAVQSKELDTRYIEVLENENKKQKAEILKMTKTTTRDLVIWGGAGIFALAITQIIVQNN